MVLICVPLMTNEVEYLFMCLCEYLFMCLLAICVSSLEKMSFQAFCPFRNWLVCLFVVEL